MLAHSLDEDGGKITCGAKTRFEQEDTPVKLRQDDLSDPEILFDLDGGGHRLPARDRLVCFAEKRRHCSAKLEDSSPHRHEPKIPCATIASRNETSSEAGQYRSP